VRAGALLPVTFNLISSRSQSSCAFTFGERLILSHAWPYSTVGELLENNSEVRAYVRTVKSPAPSSMTVRLVVRAVVRITVIDATSASFAYKRNIQHLFHLYLILTMAWASSDWMQMAVSSQVEMALHYLGLGSALLRYVPSGRALATTTTRLVGLAASRMHGRVPEVFHGDNMSDH
jgi:hypothetical protein